MLEACSAEVATQLRKLQFSKRQLEVQIAAAQRKLAVNNERQRLLAARPEREVRPPHPGRLAQHAPRRTNTNNIHTACPVPRALESHARFCLALQLQVTAVERLRLSSVPPTHPQVTGDQSHFKLAQQSGLLEDLISKLRHGLALVDADIGHLAASQRQLQDDIRDKVTGGRCIDRFMWHFLHTVCLTVPSDVSQSIPALVTQTRALCCAAARVHLVQDAPLQLLKLF